MVLGGKQNGDKRPFHGGAGIIIQQTCGLNRSVGRERGQIKGTRVAGNLGDGGPGPGREGKGGVVTTVFFALWEIF